MEAIRLRWVHLQEGVRHKKMGDIAKVAMRRESEFSQQKGTALKCHSQKEKRPVMGTDPW